MVATITPVNVTYVRLEPFIEGPDARALKADGDEEDQNEWGLLQEEMAKRTATKIIIQLAKCSFFHEPRCILWDALKHYEQFLAKKHLVWGTRERHTVLQ